MRVQEAVVRQLKITTTATYALTGARVYWAITAKDPVLPFIRVRKSGHESMASGMIARRLPANATIEIVAYAKSQDAAADLAEAITSDLVGFTGSMPSTSPVTAGAIWVSQIEVIGEEDLVSEEAVAMNIFAESRDYIVRYDQR